MQLYEMQVSKTAITRAAAVKVPYGVIGAVVRFSFSPEWEGLNKTVVFRAGEVSKDILDVEEFAVIPAECTQELGQLLEVGVYGVDAENTVAIPTMWEAIGRISEATDPSGDASTEPTLPVWAQLQERLKQLEETGVSQAEIEKAVEAYFDGNHPTGQKTENGGEIFNFYTDPVYTGDNPPKEYPGNTAAKGSHAEGFGTHADGEYAHAEGWNSTASGGIAHAEGKLTKAAGYASHAEGGETQANGSYAHSEGLKTEANAPYSHAEGEGSKTEYDGTNGKYAHAEGFRTTTYNTAAHAEGVQTEARGYASHTGGRGTIATCRYQMATGMFNIPDEVKYSDGRGEYAEIVGGGSNEKNRSNIYTLDWDGNGWFSGGVYVGEYNGRYKKLATVYEIPTTAAEVGAVPTTRTVNGRALSSNISLTASDVGAAPAGFGLGGGSISISDANAVAANGWYYIAAGTVNKPEHITYGTLFHKVRTSNNMMQEVIDIFGNMAVRTLRDGIWQEWEYVNPPMMPDIEYRTTERSGGLPVYTKTFALQPNVMTSFGIGEYDHGITGFKYLCRVEARTENYVLPLITNERTVCIAGVTATKVKIAATKQDFTDYTSITLWYTKN